MKTLLLGAAVLAFAACGSDSPDDPTDPDNPDNPDNPDDPTDPDPDTTARDRDELAAVIAGHVRAEFALQLAAAELSRGRPVEGFTMTTTAIEGSHGVGAIGGMNFEFDLICHDAAMPRNAQFCDGTAHHSHFKVTAMGSQSIGGMSMDAMNRLVDWEIRDISLEKARFRGPDDVTVTTQITADNVATYAMTFNATYEQVRFSVGQMVPTYGTIDFILDVERTRADDVRAFASQAHLEYTNSGALLSLDGQSYSIDLASGAVTKI